MSLPPRRQAQSRCQDFRKFCPRRHRRKLHRPWRLVRDDRANEGAEARNDRLQERPAQTQCRHRLMRGPSLPLQARQDSDKSVPAIPHSFLGRHDKGQRMRATLRRSARGLRAGYYFDCEKRSSLIARSGRHTTEGCASPQICLYSNATCRCAPEPRAVAP